MYKFFGNREGKLQKFGEIGGICNMYCWLKGDGCPWLYHNNIALSGIQAVLNGNFTKRNASPKCWSIQGTII